MSGSDPALSPQAISPLTQSPKNSEELQDSGAKIMQKEGVEPLAVRIKDLDESQSELLSKIQGLKQNVQSWRSMVDTQLKSYKDELSGLKKQLETELEQLSSDFNELKTTLQKQQEDVTNSLKNLGLQDVRKHSGESEIENKELQDVRKHSGESEIENKGRTSDKAQDSTSESKDGVGELSTE